MEQIQDLFKLNSPTVDNARLLNKIDAQINDVLTSSGKKQYCKVGRRDNNQYSHELGKAIRSERHVRCMLGKESTKQNSHF